MAPRIPSQQLEMPPCLRRSPEESARELPHGGRAFLRVLALLVRLTEQMEASLPQRHRRLRQSETANP